MPKKAPLTKVPPPPLALTPPSYLTASLATGRWMKAIGQMIVLQHQLRIPLETETTEKLVPQQPDLIRLRGNSEMRVTLMEVMIISRQQNHLILNLQLI